MKLRRRQFLHLVAGAAALPAVSCIARAQVYPSRPISIIVAYPPGGGSDTIARIMAESMRVSLGRPVIIEKVAGANGSIGVGRVARSANDGYTLGIGNIANLIFNGALYPLEYDLVKDFESISLISTGTFLIIARKGVPANDLRRPGG